MSRKFKNKLIKLNLRQPPEMFLSMNDLEIKITNLKIV